MYKPGVVTKLPMSRQDVPRAPWAGRHPLRVYFIVTYGTKTVTYNGKPSMYSARLLANFIRGLMGRRYYKFRGYIYDRKSLVYFCSKEADSTSTGNTFMWYFPDRFTPTEAMHIGHYDAGIWPFLTLMLPGVKNRNSPSTWYPHYRWHIHLGDGRNDFLYETGERKLKIDLSAFKLGRYR